FLSTSTPPPPRSYVIPRLGLTFRTTPPDLTPNHHAVYTGLPQDNASCQLQPGVPAGRSRAAHDPSDRQHRPIRPTVRNRADPYVDYRSPAEVRMAASPGPPDPAQPDLYWSGPSGWAMIPGVLIGGAVSLIVLFGLPPIGRWVGLPPDWTSFLLFWLTLFGWIALGLVWAYRGASFVYRLTPSHLYVDFGMLYRPVAPIELAQVVGARGGAWGRGGVCGVGWLMVRGEARPPLWLRAIFRPERFAAVIRDAVAKARGG